MLKISNKIRTFLSGDKRSVTVKKNVIASLLLKGISIIVSFLLVPLTIGYVSSELYGVWLTLSSILTWIGFLDLGFSQGLKNKLTEAIAHDDWEKGRSLVSTTYLMMIFIFVPVCIILEILIPQINWSSLLNISVKYEGEIVRSMYALVAFACLQIIFNVIIDVVAAFQKVALSTSFNVIANVLALLVIYILTKTCPPSLFVLSFTMALMPVLVIGFASIILYHGKFSRVSPTFKSINRLYVKDIFGLGYKLFIINVQAIVLNQTTNFLISNVSSPTDVTRYNVAFRLISCALLVFNIVTAPLWPAYTDAYSKNDFEWMKRTHAKMEKVLLISLLTCAVLVIFSKLIYHIWIGNKVDVPFMMTLLVAIFMSMQCCINVNSVMLIGIGKIQIDAFISLIGMIVYIPFSLLLGKLLGAYGVILALITIDSIFAIILYIQSRKILNNTAKGIWSR